MSKKKFTAGLESVFGDPSEASFRSGGLIIAEEEPKDKRPSKKPSRKKAKSRKNFTTDLDSLFEDVLKETIVEQAEALISKKELENKTKSASNKTRTRKPLTGLDALIRRTTETSSIEIESDVKKRVTFVFEKKKLDKLKKIARIKKAYLKDILSDIVSEYVERHESSKMNFEN